MNYCQFVPVQEDRFCRAKKRMKKGNGDTKEQPNRQILKFHGWNSRTKRWQTNFQLNWIKLKFKSLITTTEFNVCAKDLLASEKCFQAFFKCEIWTICALLFPFFIQMKNLSNHRRLSLSLFFAWAQWSIAQNLFLICNSNYSRVSHSMIYSDCASCNIWTNPFQTDFFPFTLELLNFVSDNVALFHVSGISLLIFNNKGFSKQKKITPQTTHKKKESHLSLAQQ